ncbi:hypothetical protein TBK1r_77590 [Stieleria magnilauensis]|uniref:Uncharacterized protein n=1 Tax=Stieleria magnilauensis TaxID=2527963 RepID=A0ABX5Y376_9BACT|nr:hypothetical protein TBK1r_77590 [Planctomycetes bacterium TBK1r]
MAVDARSGAMLAPNARRNEFRCFTLVQSRVIYPPFSPPSTRSSFGLASFQKTSEIIDFVRPSSGHRCLHRSHYPAWQKAAIDTGGVRWSERLTSALMQSSSSRFVSVLSIRSRCAVKVGRQCTSTSLSRSVATLPANQFDTAGKRGALSSDAGVPLEKKLILLRGIPGFFASAG